jgi:hypothetical protein
MEVTGADSTTARHYRLLGPVRDQQGLSHFNEQPRIIREFDNFDRHMYLVRFDDGSTTFLFPYELMVECRGSASASV